MFVFTGILWRNIIKSSKKHYYIFFVFYINSGRINRIKGKTGSGGGIWTPDTRIMIPLLWPTELLRQDDKNAYSWF